MEFSVFGFEVEPWMFAVLTSCIICWELGRLWMALRSEFWSYVMGTIHEARIENHPDSDRDDFFVAHVRYEYYVAGVTYTGKRLVFHPKGSYRHRDMVKALEGVTESTKHRVYFHPKYHRLCVLKPGAGLANYLVLVVFLAVTLIAFYAQVTPG